MEFDIVTVGARSAGCALANRLSADERYSIALVEAGPADLHPWIHVPIGYFRTMNTHDSTGCISRKKNEGITGWTIIWPRGWVLGGSNSINGVLYVRGQPQDTDNWAQLGCTGFMLVQLFGQLLLFIFPQLVLWLPSVMSGN